MSDKKWKKLVAIDLDGTLLKDDKTINEFSKTWLKNLESAGFLIVLCSGRSYKNVVQFYHDIGLKESPIISYNGHYVANPSDASFGIYEEVYTPEIIRPISDLMLKYTNNQYAESFDNVYLQFPDKYLEAFYQYKSKDMHYGKLSETVNENIMCVVFELPEIDYKKQEIQRLTSEIIPGYNMRFWDDDKYCEVYKEGISKASSIRYVAKKYNLTDDDVITFGDANNDIEIVHEFKGGYGMKNATPHLKEMAQNITKYTNEEDGVVRTLLEIFSIN